MKLLNEIDTELLGWIEEQRVFFVATAPLSAANHVNLSPKGGDSFRVTGPLEVIYQDYTGSGAETVAHLRENGRIVVMFCAFSGSPSIVRLYGKGSVILPNDPLYGATSRLFPENPGTRCFIKVSVERVSSSCGYSVPFFEHLGPRETLDKWAEKQGVEKLNEYRTAKNRKSIDGLAALPENGPSPNPQTFMHFR